MYDGLKNALVPQRPEYRVIECHDALDVVHADRDVADHTISFAVALDPTPISPPHSSFWRSAFQ